MFGRFERVVATRKAPSARTSITNWKITDRFGRWFRAQRGWRFAGGSRGTARTRPESEGGQGRRRRPEGWGRLLPLSVKTGLGGDCPLKFGAEPADEAEAFFGGAGGVECDEAEEDALVREVGRPTLGFGDGAIQIVMEFTEDHSGAAKERAENDQKLQARSGAEVAE